MIWALKLEQKRVRDWNVKITLIDKHGQYGFSITELI